jgi:chemotaxis protein MotB
MSHGSDDGIPEEHEEHVNHEAWVIPYADLLTLLMAMFIALFAMSTVDISKFKALAIGFNEALGGGKLDSGIGGAKNTSPAFGHGNGQGPLNGGTALKPEDGLPPGTTLAQVLEALAQKNGNNAAKAQEKATLADVKNAIEEAAKKGGFAKNLKIVERNNGLLVTLVTDQVLFASGQSVLRPESGALLNAVGLALKTIDNQLQITGFTDSQAFNGPHGNDELSFERALAVKYYLVGIGIPDARMSVDGEGARDPVDVNTTVVGRQHNRRVEIVVQSNLVKKTLDANGLDNKAVTPSTSPIPPVTNGVGGVTSGVNPGIG